MAADFDRIALLSNEEWNHNRHYHSFLLRQIPPRCEEALEIGCGTGTFSRLLAERSDHVLALDLAPAMIEIARERSGQYPNVDFRVVNAIAWELPVERFDCIASIATLHHLPIEEMLVKMREALTANGMLVVLDLYESKGPSDLLVAALAVPASTALRLVRNGRVRDAPKVREAWTEHGQHDTYPTLSQVRRVCATVLPGAKVRRHLLWRYSITWHKD